MEHIGDLKSPTTFADPAGKCGYTILNIVDQDEEQGDIQPQAGGPSVLAISKPGVQKEVIIDRPYRGLVLIVEVTNVVHGTLSPNGDPATLIVLGFKFRSTSISRRFTHANITVTFLDPDDAVQGIAPDNACYLLPTKETTEVTDTVGVNGITLPAVTVNAGISHQYKTISEKEDFARVICTARKLGNGGTENAVEWTLLENSTAKSGIPTFLQAAILLKRKQNPGKKFEANVEINVGVDWITKFETITHKIPKPVSFDPAVDINPNGQKWRRDNLEKEDLKALQKILYPTPVDELETPVKGKDGDVTAPRLRIEWGNRSVLLTFQ